MSATGFRADAADTGDHRAARGAQAPRRAVWPWVLLLGLFGLALLLAATGASALLALADAAREGIEITVHGERWELALDEEQRGLAFVGIAVVLLTLLVVVPCALLLALLAAATGLGLTLLAVLAVAVLALSPLWLPIVVAWLLLRRRPAAAATMQG